ncbi:MAG: OB-fold nucleic acid binding domain-containing protein [Nocardioidaceae bacterium]
MGESTTSGPLPGSGSGQSPVKRLQADPEPVPDRSGGFLRRTLDRLSSSTGDLEAAELREDSAAAGGRPIRTCDHSEVVTVHGTLRTVTLRPRAGVSALEADLYDGSGTVRLVWLGRRRIPGIDSGTAITVTGRIGLLEGERVLYNPRYELAT